LDKTSIQTTQIRSLSDLEDYLDAWRVLADGTPMQSPEWLLAWWQHYAEPDDELCVLLFHEPRGQLVGLSPLFIQIAGKRRTVCLLGSGDASTNHTTWLAAAGWETWVSRAVTQFLLGLKPGWNCVQLDSIDADDISINATVTCMEEKGCLVLRKQLHNCWKIALPSTWEEYLMMLSRLQRKRCRKLQRYFESGLVRVHKATNTADFHRGFEILLHLHGIRWGEPDKPLGCFSDQQFRAFHETVALELLKRNQLLLVWLEYDGRPIAVEYQFINKKAVYSYLAGMDPSVTEFSPGNLSILASIQYAIAEGCESFDLSRGDQPYKAHWRATPTPCYGIRIWPDHLSGRLEKVIYGILNQAEAGKKRSVKWIKARVPQRFINAWRQMHSIVTGRRRGPRKVSSK
jgi:CelD/BcsL family acetyltransferase involved in cellulose biosynthesis